MRICVCVAQAPFMRGGAELLVENLSAALRRAGHQAEIVRLPVAWDRDHLLSSALAWRMVTLDCDLVICTNFPSYLIEHPRKVVWLLHQHRPAYDSYGLEWAGLAEDGDSTDTIAVLARWDTTALSEATRLFAFSEVVADRARRFNGVSAEVLYHPPPLVDRLHSGESGDYLLCVSRLERNKRVDMVVSAFLETQVAGRLLIAGGGSERERLETLARPGRERIEFLGHVPDEILVDTMADCRAVVYTPHDEDYGYATLQAFAAEKPVITTDDAGGVLEWVRPGVTGWVTAPSAAALAGAMTEALSDVGAARAMGLAAHPLVAELDWNHVVASLIA